MEKVSESRENDAQIYLKKKKSPLASQQSSAMFKTWTNSALRPQCARNLP